MTGNRSFDAGRKILPSSNVPSGMRTFTSRSTVTSYLRGDVDQVRVNTERPPGPNYLRLGPMSSYLALNNYHTENRRLNHLGIFRRLLRLRNRQSEVRRSRIFLSENPDESEPGPR